MALGDDMALFMIGRDFVRAVPCAVLTTDAAGIIVKDDAVVEFDVTVGRTADEAGRINTVVTAHGIKQQEGIGEASPLHLSHASPFDVGRVVVLFIARHFATAASDAFGRIKMETVLLPFF